jgi:chromosome segregation ATPase
MEDFINSQISKILKVENLKEFLKDISKLQQEKIYITEDEYLIEKGFIVEKIKKETILKIKEIEEIKRRIDEERKRIDELSRKSKKVKEERGKLKKRIEEIDKEILEAEKNLRIKESEYEIVKFNLKNFENNINNDEIEI